MQRPTPDASDTGDPDSSSEIGALVQVAPSGSQKGLVAVVALVVVTLLVLATWRPDANEPGATSGPSNLTAIASASTPPANPSPRPTVTPGPTPTVLPSPAPDSCLLPETLPTPEPPIAAPTVASSPVAMVFSSYLYAGDVINGPVAVRDDEQGDWAMGLWFAAPGIEAPRLLAAPEGGIVIPLALTPAGDAAAVWWLPERRGYGQPPPCTSGIYVVATDGSGSRLVESGDWSIPFTEFETAEYNWRDPDIGSLSGRRYMLPTASFSGDGTWLAVIDGKEITISAAGPETIEHHHTGNCPQWGWSPVGATFVAGCEDMTSAWLVPDLASGNGPSNLALPAPRIGDLGPDWEVGWARAIGLTRDGNIRVARFYGYATGCESEGCTIPEPGFVVSTIDPDTSAETTRSGTVSFLTDADRPTHFSADATWVYTDDLDGAAQTIRIGLGTISTTKRLETYAGAAIDGSVLYGSRVVEAGSRVVVESVNRDGRRISLTSITWPATAETTFAVLRIEGLQVAKPT